ncbi:hypothetical protein KIW84_034035 [Lathyrus oleraceus]|uniref:Pentatricopeptide repeat-containing protein n=1 Tax=Pisum sativum TaxID=3888 RepID=A0A9D4XZM8_PEA|nr:hypothetical protein KIW84_034035 [Pisum sativum]
MVRNPLSKSANKYLRKFRKWPHSPYKTSWHHNFGEQQAMQILKQATTTQPQTQNNNNNNNNPFLLSTLIHSFKAYDTDPTPKAYFFLIKTLTKNNPLHLHEIPHILNHLEYNEKFESPEFMKRECLKMVPDILLKSQQMKIRLEESSFRVLIKALCRIKRVDYAVKIMNCMIEDGYSLDDKICSLIVSSLCEQNDMTSAEALFVWGNMRKLGFCPGVMDCTNMIRFLVKEGKGKDALEILNQLKEDGVKPDIVCYTIVLSGIVKEE